MIKTEKLCFKYESEEGHTPGFVIENLDLEIKEGSFVALLGHNGCGKSTLAKLFNGILLPTSGKVLVDGMDTADESKLFDIRRTAGMVFQNPDNQIVSSIVEEDVAFACENIGLPQKVIRQRVDEALAAVGMTEYAHNAPHLLSGGQKQRVAIAGVLAMQPRALILDEPTAMLDPHGRREVMDTVLRLNREKGMTVVLITHHMEEAAQADRIIVMSRGKVELDGKPGEIFSQVEKMRELRLDVPQTVQVMYGLSKELDLSAFSVEKCAEQIEKYLKQG